MIGTKVGKLGLRLDSGLESGHKLYQMIIGSLILEPTICDLIVERNQILIACFRRTVNWAQLFDPLTRSLDFFLNFILRRVSDPGQSAEIFPDTDARFDRGFAGYFH